MTQETLYIKLSKNVEVDKEDVTLKDIGKLYCKDHTILSKCSALKILKMKKDGPQKKVISVMKIIEQITQQLPNVEIQNIGETDTLIELIRVDEKKGVKIFLKILFVSLISFFGTAFTIMAYHNDIGIERMFMKFHSLVLGQPTSGCSVLEISYSVGLCLGMIIFFNHIGGRRITKDPTPIEVEMRVYEKDVNDSLIETAQREAKEIDLS